MKVIKFLLFFSLLCTIIIYLFPRTWELDLIAGLQENKTCFTIYFFQFISDSKSFITVGLPVALLTIGIIKHDPSLREKAFLVLFSLALAGILSTGVKRIVREPRPYEVDSRITQLSVGGGYGFPSGHTLEAVAAATTVSVLWPELWIIATSVVWVVLIGMSRIYLGVHDPGDAVGGLFLGLLSTFLVIKLRDYVLRSRRQAK